MVRLSEAIRLADSTNFSRNYIQFLIYLWYFCLWNEALMYDGHNYHDNYIKLGDSAFGGQQAAY